MSTGRYATPRVAIDRWLNSDGHRENLFRPEWRTTGVALLPHATAHWDKNNTTVRDGIVWVNQFGNSYAGGSPTPRWAKSSGQARLTSCPRLRTVAAHTVH
jgi:hypothetical protein